MLTYLEAISKGFPNVQCYCVGNGDIYEDLIWASGPPIPSKETLDQWISSNTEEKKDRRITVFAFRNRFTVSEKINIDLMSIDNPNSSVQERQMAATIRVIIKDTDTASFIDLDNPDTQKGVRAFEAFGLLENGRYETIINTEVVDNERLPNLGNN